MRRSALRRSVFASTTMLALPFGVLPAMAIPLPDYTIDNSNLTTVEISNAQTVTSGRIAGIGNESGFIQRLINSGTISGGVDNGAGRIGSVSNSGLIDATAAGQSNHMGVDNSGGVIDVIANSTTGAITGQSYGVNNGAPGSRITTITNRGAITGGVAGIDNTNGRIGAFNNATTVTYVGALPENYNVILNTNTAGGYGQLVATGAGVTGTLRFGVDASSALALGFYPGVLEGMTAANIDDTTRIGRIGETTRWVLQDRGDFRHFDLVIEQVVYTIDNSELTTALILVDRDLPSGQISGVGNWQGQIGTLRNTGIIRGGVHNPFGTIALLQNDGRIVADGEEGGNRSGVSNYRGVISTLRNNAGGAISGVDYGVDNSAMPEPAIEAQPSAPSLITELTNLGAITGGVAGVNNIGGRIVTFNNATPVTFFGTLPEHYNVIIRSNTAGGYGQLVASYTTGVTRFGVAAGSTLSVGRYAGVLQGVTAANIEESTRTGVVDRMRWALVDENGDNAWDLFVRRRGPDVANTIAALRRNASSLNEIINQRSAHLAHSLDHDCAVFDKNGICVSIGARYAGVGSNSDAGVLGVAAWRLTQDLRVGAFIDQTITETTPGRIAISNATPMLGAFIVYEQKADMTGLRLRGAFAWRQSKLSPSREILAETEGGDGSARLNSYAFAAEASYGFPMSKDWVIAPYAGLRRSVVERQAYTERLAEGVEFPISYDTYGQYLTTATAGLRVSGRLSQQVTALVGIGVEHDLTSKMDRYSGTSAIYELESFALDTAGSRHRTRAVGSAALRYDLGETRAVSLAAALRQSPYGSHPAFSAVLRLTAGF